jgi:hypothetical protein
MKIEMQTTVSVHHLRSMTAKLPKMAGMGGPGRIALATLAALFGAAAPAAAADRCLTADPPPIAKPPQTLRFGITPQAAGSAGAGQAQVAPVDEGAAAAALRELKPGAKPLVMRLNRLFWADGDEGIARFGALADRYAAQGFRVESQVRYHPPEGSAGDIAGWERYVRRAVRELGRRPSVVAFSITNEANLPASPNTSDGAYSGVVDALVRGVIVAREELDSIGRTDVDVGFTLMWRWTPESDAKFWDDIAARATPAFRSAVDHVGLQIYPGLVWPPAPRPGVSAGDEVVEALTLLRRCYMPIASLGSDVDVWVSENGYATNLGRTEADQAAALDSTVRAVHAWSGELGISDYRYFNLRDNKSTGTDLFAAVGLLRDDYSRKPAVGVYRELVDAFGASVVARARSRLTLRLALGRVRGRVVLPAGAPSAACSGVVVVRFARSARRSAAVGRSCAYAVRLPRGARVARVVAHFGGNFWLRPARRGVRVG